MQYFSPRYTSNFRGDLSRIFEHGACPSSWWTACFALIDYCTAIILVWKPRLVLELCAGCRGSMSDLHIPFTIRGSCTASVTMLLA